MPVAVLAQSVPPAATLPEVEVIGTSPLPGQGIDRNLLPYSTHVLRRDDIDRTQAANLVDQMNRTLPGVQLQDALGSPYQSDLTYRGFRASGLLGASQGLSVHVDGVRVNEPFGDVVNWDMIPEFSVNSLTLVPGANPAFGLNTLGGALAYTTHNGISAPGVRAQVEAGSFGRVRGDVSYGLHRDDGWHAYAAASAFDENGWRDHSPSRLGQLFAKVGRVSGDTDWDLGLQLGTSELVGNGPVPAYTLEAQDGQVVREPDLYAARRESIYNWPDTTTNGLTQLAGHLHRRTAAGHELEMLAYARESTRDTVNGDEAENPTDEANASFNTTSTRQHSYGAALSLSSSGGRHQWQVGGSFDASRIRYEQLEQPAMFTPDRGVEPGDVPPRPSVQVSGHATSAGLYTSDTWELAPATHLTGTLRYNVARVSNQLTSIDDDTGESQARPEETFTYRSLNPALGITQQLSPALTLFANLARNNRVPTVIELGCADPAEPCRLPAGLTSDPYLDQVVSGSLEFGARGRLAGDMRYSLAAFRTDNRDDILFRSVAVNSQLGYFQNFERTRYQGLDAEWSAELGAWTLGAGYSLLDATYQADGVLRQGNRNVEVHPGTRIAGLPRHSLKLSADWRAGASWTLGGDLQAVSGRGSAGNEDGRVEDGSDTPVNVDVPGYAVLNLRASWRPPTHEGWEVVAKVDNVFDRRYENYGALGETVFDAQGSYTGVGRNALFVGPGTPRSVAIGLRLRY